jgi:DNA-binding SARP family transcriptional activator
LDRKRERPVIWVSGPPGCGKTTLVSSYLEARKLPCLWYQLEAGDADPATFFYFLGQAVQKASPRKRRPLPLLTPEYLQGIPTFTLRYFQSLYDRLRIPGILVFDNYQDVPAGAAWHEILLTGLSSLPEGMNAVLISRSDPPPGLIRLQANHLMEILGWKDLQLTLDESEGMVRLRAKNKLSRKAIRHMHREMDGWAAGLVLGMESERIEDRQPESVGKLAPEKVFDYFASEIFDRTDEEVQKFLLQTAFFPKMTAPMAEGLTGQPSASRILSTLSRNHYFTEKRFPAAPIYQYHPLFREFLISRAKETFSPALLSSLFRRAAVFLEEDGQEEASVSLFREAGDWEGMIRLILKNAPSMVEQGRTRSLEEWLNGLPRGLFENHPWLLYWMGACRQPFDPAFARPFFEKAFERFRNQSDAAGAFMAWSGIVSSILSAFENYKSLDRWISVLENLLHDFREFPSEEVGALVTCNMMGALVVRQPHHPDVEAWAQRALEAAERQANISFQLQTFIRLAIYRTYIGDTQESLQAIHSIQHLTRSPDAPPLALVAAKHAEAMHYSQAEESHEKCLKAVSESLELARTTGVHRLDLMVLGQGVNSALKAGDRETVENLLDQMAASSQSFRPWEACFYHLLRTREGLLQGAFKQASLHAEMALQCSEEVGSPISSVRCHLATAHVMHQLGKPRKAAEYLARAMTISRRIKAKNSEFWAFLAKALFALEQGEEASGLTSLRKALAIGREEGYFITFIDRPFAMARLCVKALEKGIEVPYAQELIRRCKLIPDKPPFHLESWPWPLKIFTLGGFQILKEDDPLKFSRKAQQRPLSMLKALIALGGKEVREDQISDALWPEADGDVAHESFATNLHRLRKLIGNEKAIQLREGRLTLDERFCWVDVWAFERILGQADVRWKEKSKENAVLLVEKAVDLYKGPFLFREIEQPWAAAMSERLRSKFLRSVGRLGQYWQEAGQWEKALDCYQKGLEVENLAEEFYQGLMTCHQHLGQRAEALSVYNRCKRALSQAFGVDPSFKTNEIYRSLLSGKQNT